MCKFLIMILNLHLYSEKITVGVQHNNLIASICLVVYRKMHIWKMRFHFLISNGITQNN